MRKWKINPLIDFEGGYVTTALLNTVYSVNYTIDTIQTALHFLISSPKSL